MCQRSRCVFACSYGAQVEYFKQKKWSKISWNCPSDGRFCCIVSLINIRSFKATYLLKFNLIGFLCIPPRHPCMSPLSENPIPIQSCNKYYICNLLCTVQSVQVALFSTVMHYSVIYLAFHVLVMKRYT